jgi:hypothetical protein
MQIDCGELKKSAFWEPIQPELVNPNTALANSLI